MTEDDKEELADDALANLMALKICLGRYSNELERNDFGVTFLRLHSFFSRIADKVDTLEEDAEIDSIDDWLEAQQKEIEELVKD